MILIVTSKDDLTADYLILRLKEREIEFFRFNTEDCATQYRIHIDIRGSGSSFILEDVTRNVRIYSKDITAAYLRKPSPPTVDCELPIEHREFIQREFSETLRSVWRLIPDSVWLNSPEKLWLAGNKCKQLVVASQLGFVVPETIISSVSDSISSFVKRQPAAIAKAVRHGYIGRDSDIDYVWTSLLEPADVSALDSTSSCVPMIVQPLLSKKHDLRVTVIGSTVFAVAIDSQKHLQTSVDWRRADLNDGIELHYYPVSIGYEMERRCVELNEKLGLRFSCIDFIVTPNDELTFLEINANGQWAWLEQFAGINLRDAIIDELLRPQYAIQ